MKCWIVTRKQLTVACSLVLALAIVLVCSVSAFASADRKIPIYCVDTPKKVVALSFDAAWGNEDTEQLIEILGKNDIKATFFVVGSWVDKYPESVKQLADAGHEIQNHSNTHPHMPKLSTEQMVEELNACNEKIEKITGQKPTLLRPPYGDYSNAVIDAAQSIGMYTIQWDVDSLDWKEGHTADRITQDVLKKVKNGSIILFHNAAKYTPEALPTIIEALKTQGYEFALISDLIYKDNYTIDHTGKQISNAQTESTVSSEPQTNVESNAATTSSNHASQ